jgi:hypothetical protein
MAGIGHFLPEPPVAGDGDPVDGFLRVFSAWEATFSVSLEVAKQTDVTRAQAGRLASVRVSRPLAPRA